MEKKYKITKNAIKCKKCGEILESKYTHDFKMCSCGTCGVDGGHSYLRRNYNGSTPEECYIELSEQEEIIE